jgi:rubredoxin
VIWTVLGTLGIVGLVIAAGVIADRRFGLLPRPRELREAGRPGWRLPPHAPGEAPETALAALPPSVRCRACRGRALPDGDSRVTYGDRELVVRRYRCPRCAAIATVYGTAATA